MSSAPGKPPSLGSPSSDPEDAFRLRAPETLRIEGLVDGVFAVAITLLVVSTEVPSDFSELRRAIAGFPAFAVCLTILLWFWYHHSQYCRRYGLQTPVATALNGVFIFAILFSVYGVKFLWTGLLGPLLATPDVHAKLTASDVRQMFCIYSAGTLALALCMVAFYAEAIVKQARLGLSPFEVLFTRLQLQRWTLLACIPALSIVLAAAAPSRWIAAAGYCYASIGFIEGIHGARRGRALKAAAPRA